MTTILATLLLSFLMILLVIVGMSVGVMNGRKAISGSCGGLNSGGCKLCGDSCRDKATASEEQ
jgi:hypothetical protein